ncbi:hypothetical protein JNA71_05665 [Bacillus halotolerans]|nr:hypothetical protein [Bacillus halotolerans]MBL6007892.1 hypothetical protein [Bacillus halotolerans]
MMTYTTVSMLLQSFCGPTVVWEVVRTYSMEVTFRHSFCFHLSLMVRMG